MKKLIAILMCLAMVLSLVACGQGNDEPKGIEPQNPSEQAADPVETAAPDETPTAEEKEMIFRCRDIINALNSYAECGYFEKGFVHSQEGWEGFSWSSDATQWTMAYCYEQLQSMAAVDKWTNSQWAKDLKIDVDRQAALANFTVLEDKFIRTMVDYTDALGQPTGDGYTVCSISMEYDDQGRMLLGRNGDGIDYIYRDHSRYVNYSYNHENYAMSRYTYNEDGTVATIDVGEFYKDEQEVEYRMTPTYDANGRIATMAVLFTNGEEGNLAYSYDEQGRLASVNSDVKGGKATWTYTYDANGNLLTETKGDNVITYTYDANNCVQTVTFASYKYEKSGTYSYDEAGHLITCKGTEKSGDDLENFEITYIYGDYYIYNSEK